MNSNRGGIPVWDATPVVLILALLPFVFEVFDNLT